MVEICLEKKCKLCGASSVKVAYTGPMRHSGIGAEKHEGYEVFSCASCFVEYIAPFPEEVWGDIYQSGTYWNRKGVGSVADIKRLHKKALAENSLWLAKIGSQNLAGRCVLDFGCGSGAFLDLIKGLARETIGVELDAGLAQFAKERGHRVFGSVNEAYAAGIQADTVISFDVLEHLSEPVAALESVKNLLGPENRLYFGVPNQHDKLKDLVPAYLPHFYHIEHLWYFESRSLRSVFEKAGFLFNSIRYLHKYNFMNIVEWARTGHAPGNPQSAIVDEALDMRVCSWLEDRGVSSHLLIEASFDG